MNKFQLFALVGGLANAIFMLLLPPYERISVGRIEPSFDAYYFVLQPPAGQTVNGDLLAIQLLAVAFSVMLALMFLRGSHGDAAHPPRNPQTVVLALAGAAFIVIMLFPPFETMPLSRMGAASFHGFDVAFGGGMQRGIFVPMLFLEILLLAVNVSVFWLLFGVLDRRDVRTADAPQFAPPTRPANQIGRSGAERRSGRVSGYQGAEQRSNRDRRAS